MRRYLILIVFIMIALGRGEEVLARDDGAHHVNIAATPISPSDPPEIYIEKDKRTGTNSVIIFFKGILQWSTNLTEWHDIDESIESPPGSRYTQYVVKLGSLKTDGTGGLGGDSAGASIVAKYFRARAEDETQPPNPPEEKVLERIEVIGPTSVDSGSTIELQCLAHYDDGSIEDVTSQAQWGNTTSLSATVTKGSVYGKIASEGKVCCSFGGKTEFYKISVKYVYSPSNLLVSLNLSGKTTVRVGEQTTLKCTAKYQYGFNDVTFSPNTTWSVFNDSPCASVDCGVVTGLKEGIVYINSTHTDHRSVGGSYKIHVTNMPDVVDIKISGSTVILYGSSCQLSCNAIYKDGSSVDVTPAAQWYTSDPSIATISDTGEVSASSWISGGNRNVTFTIIYGNVTKYYGIILIPYWPNDFFVSSSVVEF